MKILQLLTPLVFFTLFAACQNYKHIAVVGQITDEITGKPIPKAEVVVLCWYNYGLDEATFKKQTLVTDKNGMYNITFDKGYEIDVASKAAGFIANRSYKKLSDNRTQIDLKLARIKENPTLVKNLSTEHIELNTTDKSPFLRIRIYSSDTSSVLDLSNMETFGFDLSNQRTSTDTSKCDIWFTCVGIAGQPKILGTNKSGGIIPVFSDEIKSSFLYEKAAAPITGYLNNYKLKGTEEGFFVLCRDGKTYGKIIFEKSEIDVSTPDGKGGFYKEFGKNFSCLYQPNGTTDLSYSTPDIDLENFLVDIRLR